MLRQRLSSEHGAVCKLVDVHPDNPGRGLPSISATVLVLDAATGRLAAVLDGRTLTELRTAAASAVAVDELAPVGVDELAVLGRGVQGLAHVRAINRVRPLRTVYLWSRSERRGRTAADTLSRELGLEVSATGTAAEAVAAAKLVVTWTLSQTPVLAVEDLRPGATVISVGSFEAHRREVSPELVRAAHVVVDDVHTALAHAGPVVEAIAAGEPRRADLTALGDVLVGTSPGHRTPGELVFYNSVGLGIQDAAAAHAVLATAGRGLAAVGLSTTLPTGPESLPGTAHP